MNDKRTSTDYRLTDLPQVNDTSNSKPAINVPDPMNGNGLSDSPVLQNAESLPDGWFDFKPEAGESAEDVLREAAVSTDLNPDPLNMEPQKPKRRGLLVAIVILLICLLAVAGVAYAFMNGLISFGQTEKQQQQQSQVQESSESSAPAVADKKVETIVTINVKADGYDRNATPIIYHVKGTSNSMSDASSASASAASASSSSSSASGSPIDEYGQVDDTMKITLEGLPEGSYTISWSNSILSDGSFYRVPKDQKFTVAGSNETYNANFEKVNGATASADDVKAAYDSIDEWLKDATGSLKSQRETILDKARLNASKAPAVMEAGGLDAIGKEAEEENLQQDAQDNGAQQQQQQVYEQNQINTPIYNQVIDDADNVDDGDDSDDDNADNVAASDNTSSESTSSEDNGAAANGNAAAADASGAGDNDNAADELNGSSDTADESGSDAGTAGGSAGGALTEAGGNDANDGGSDTDAGGDSDQVGGSYESTGDYE